MRFTPTTFFGSQVKPCVVAEGSGSVSQSFQLGSTQWDFYLFSASQQTGGGGVQNFTFSILTGSTTNAIIGAVGGAGAGSSDGRGGGGGGFDLRTNVFLDVGDYTVEVGEGANKVIRATQGLGFSGDNGRDSFIRLPGQDNVRGYGGKGGNLGGNGGTSGIPTDNVGDLSGGGAYETPTDDRGGPGLTLFFGEDVQFRAGGGGVAEGESNFGRSEPFGGGGSGLYGDGKFGYSLKDYETNNDSEWKQSFWWSS